MPVSVFAQDAAKVGLVMTSSASVAAIFHVGDAVAIRPEISIASSTTTNTNGPTETKTTNRQLTPGFSLLFYTGKWDALRTYVSPRYAYRRIHGESSSQLDE